MQGLVRSGRLAILILGLAGITARAAAQGKPDQPVDLNASGDVQPVTGRGRARALDLRLRRGRVHL